MLFVSVPIVFTGYGFNAGLNGTTFVFMIVGSVIGEFVCAKFQKFLKSFNTFVCRLRN
jgi:hypothetical protein